MALSKCFYSSPLGDLSLISSKEGLVGIWFLGQTYFEAKVVEKVCFENSPFLDQAKTFLDQYFSGQAPDLRQLPLDLRGSAFQMKVWQLLQEIPFGESRTYGQLAEQLHLKSAQAVGGAVGRNPVSILIPCHRVLSQTGHLTGYAGGLDKKAWLLEHEGIPFKTKIS